MEVCEVDTLAKLDRGYCSPGSLVTQENVEIAQRWLGSFDGDAEVFRGTLHPDIEWYPFEDNHTPSYGIEGAMRIRNGWLDAWEEMQVDLEQVVDSDDCVVASVHVTGRGRSSGVEVDVRLHLLFTIRDQKIAYVFEHTERAAALKAAGLTADTRLDIS
jgi:ketosteroid isomerase-like protein